MFNKCLIEKLQYLFAYEAALKEDWKSWEEWGKATDVQIIQEALKRCADYIEKEIKATYYN